VAAAAATSALERAETARTALDDIPREAGARRLALTLGRTLALALLVEHAQAMLDLGAGRRALAASRRFAHNGVDLLGPGQGELGDDALLANGESG
jgi:hypothetical protein